MLDCGAHHNWLGATKGPYRAPYNYRAPTGSLYIGPYIGGGPHGAPPQLPPCTSYDLLHLYYYKQENCTTGINIKKAFPPMPPQGPFGNVGIFCEAQEAVPVNYSMLHIL